MVRYAAPLVPGPRHRRHDHQPDQTIDRHEAVRAPQGTSGSAAGRTPTGKSAGRYAGRCLSVPYSPSGRVSGTGAPYGRHDAWLRIWTR